METKYKIHAGYVLAILLTAIIGLVAVRTTNIPGFVDYVSFALTLTALVLAILAIVFGLFSNTSISTTLSSLKEYSETATRSSAQLARTTDSLQAIVECIPQRLDSVEATVKSTQALLEQSRAEPDMTVERTESTEISAEAAHSFLQRASFGGYLALHAAHRAWLKDQPLDIEKAFPLTGSGYMHGFLVAARAAGFIESKSESGTVRVSWMHDVLAAEALPAVERWRKERGREGPTDVPRRMLEGLESYLNQAQAPEATPSEPKEVKM